ncbi:MAG: tRNA-intron lyase [Candidatus Diapherotrites archaeon]|nr:tRNA-intron lyase [Candidatus Diapherotrites archaeon]
MALLSGQKVIVTEKKLGDQLQQKAFGERKQNRQILDLKEALYLLDRGKIDVETEKEEKVSFDDLLKHASVREANFYKKFVVYTDLRERGYCVKTGFKFGFDLRVYPRGKRPGQEHTQWVVKVAEQTERVSMPEYSRMVRLAQNLKTTALIAIVDSEDDINYYEAKRIVP